MNFDFAVSCEGLASRALLTNHVSERHGEISILLVGDLLGCLGDDGTVNQIGDRASNELVQCILHHKDTEELDLNRFVGGFTVVCIFHAQSKLIISVSTCCVSPFIQHDQHKIVLNFNENRLLQAKKEELSDLSLLSIAKSHQLVNRFPTSFFGCKDIPRIPQGHTAEYNILSKDISLFPFIFVKSFQFSSSRFSNALSSTLSLYSKKYGQDLGLLFSGGLDSSCLASALKSLGITIPFFHIDYKGKHSQRSCLAHKISQYLGFKTHHLPRHHSKISPENMLNNCRAGLVTVPNMMYLGSPINQYISGIMPKYLITGQGADSIYVIDSFAPSTETIGLNRLKSIMNSVEDRLALVPEKIFEILGLEPNQSVDLGLLESSRFQELLSQQCGSFVEHVSYRNFKPRIGDQVFAYRSSQIYDEIVSILRVEIPKFNLSILEIYRYIKWMRSLVNVPMQYASAYLAQGIQRLTPFLEGPLVNMLFSYDLSCLDAIMIKQELETLFQYHADITHRKLVERFIAADNVYSKKDFGIKIADEMSISKYKQNGADVLSELKLSLKNSTFSSTFKNNITQSEHLLRISSLL